jgi:hypothetical protein
VALQCRCHDDADDASTSLMGSKGQLLMRSRSKWPSQAEKMSSRSNDDTQSLP